ncbi:type II secretion system protein, partial [Candidatus Peregrinibacteria bacterium]|nr:type II secretion system protein [Candidatus Peregrinibacteria bacterium]
MSKKRGFTLIEVLVAVSLFGAVGMMVITVFFNIIRIQGRLALENAIYEDARFMMERMARSIRNNAVDYEEYFNKKAKPGTPYQYGDLYGCYAAQFYNPGKGKAGSIVTNPGQLGAICNDATQYQGQDCVVYKPSVDINTGIYPYKGKTIFTDSNAFCPKDSFGGLTCTDQSSYAVDELYLIDKDGRSKTIFAKKLVGDSPVNEYALAILKKNGQDSNSDGIYETWRKASGTSKFLCDSNYDCPDTLTSLESTLDGVTNG